MFLFHKWITKYEMTKDIHATLIINNFDCTPFSFPRTLLAVVLMSLINCSSSSLISTQNEVFYWCKQQLYATETAVAVAVAYWRWLRQHLKLVILFISLLDVFAINMKKNVIVTWFVNKTIQKNAIQQSTT